MKKDTAAVHAGTRRDKDFPGINSPVYVSTSYAYLDSDERVYPRYFNTPNQEIIVKNFVHWKDLKMQYSSALGWQL